MISRLGSAYRQVSLMQQISREVIMAWKSRAKILGFATLSELTPSEKGLIQVQVDNSNFQPDEITKPSSNLLV